MAASDLVRGVATGASGGTVTGAFINVTAPGGAQAPVAGDQLLLHVTTREIYSALRIPAGWELLARPVESNGEGLFLRAKYGTDVTGSSWTIDNGEANVTATKWVWSLVVLRGDRVGDYLTGAAQHRSSSGTSTPSPAITTSAPANLIAAAGDRISLGSTWTWPAGWAEQTDIMNEAAGGTNLVSSSVAIFDTTPAPAGSYSVTPTNSTTGGIGWAGIFAYEVVSEPVEVTPVANFTASATSGNAPLTVQFTDTSTNTPTSWSWAFGDGTTSTAQNPSKTYSTPGTYTVTLTATNAGGSDGETKTDYITVTAPPVAPVANFAASATSGNAPLAVQFTDTSTNSPTAWAWNFGDGSTSTAQNPSHTYSAPGTYTVTLTATNAGGSDGETKTGFITVTAAPVAPVANFTATPTSGVEDLSVQFTDTSTNTPTAWAWNFGDGGTSTVRNPLHTYADAGTYTVTLTATNAAGSDGETKTGFITVTAAPVTPPPDSKSAAALLARPGKVTMDPLYTTAIDIKSPPASTTYDFRGSRLEGYFWADATYGYGRFTGDTATAHEKNSRPFRLGDTDPIAEGAALGGVVVGDQPTNLTWNSHKHGSPAQEELDQGIDPDEVWSRWGGVNIDGDCRAYVAQGSWFVVDGIRLYNTHDGFGMYGATENPADTGEVIVRNMWVYRNHDDSLENDTSQLKLTVEDCLFEEVFSFISTRAGVTTGSPDPTKPQTVRNSIVWLKPHPGPHKEKSTVFGHGYYYKHQTNSPPLVLENVILASEKAASSTGYVLPTFAGCSYTNVTVVWLGVGAYPGNVPPGVTVTTDRSVLDNAVADWKYRHGVTNFDTVDMNLMLAPRASGGSAPAVTNLVASIPGRVGDSTLSTVAAGTVCRFNGSWSVEDAEASTGALIRWYVDGLLVGQAERTGPIPVGTYSSQAAETWTATSGAHVLEMRVTPSGTLTESSTTDNAATRNFTVASAAPQEPPNTGPLPGLIAGVEPEAQSHMPPFCDTNGNLYRISEEPAAGGNNPQMLKSTNGGSTWTIVDAAGQMAGSSFNDMEASWTFQVGTAIALLFSDDTSVFYATFNTSDAPTNPDTWQVKEKAFTLAASSGSRSHVSGVALSDGRVRVFALGGPSGANFQTVYATKSDALAAGGWSAQSAFQPTTSSYIGVTPAVGAADLVHMFFHDYVNKQIRYRTLTSAGVLGSSVRVDTTGTHTSSANYLAAGNAVYYEAGGSWTAAALYASSAGVRCVSVVDGVVQAEQLVDSAAPLISPPNTDGASGSDGPALHLALHGTTLHAIWTEASTGDLYHSSRPHGGTWTPRTRLWDAPSGRFAFWPYNNVYTRGGVTVMGYVYDDGPHADDASNTTYNHLSLTFAPPPEDPGEVGRVLDLWDGTTLKRRVIEVWDGTTLKRRVTEL